MSDQWLDIGWMVTSDEPEVARPSDPRSPILHLKYGEGTPEEERAVCNLHRSDATMCRLWKNHPGPHVPFSAALVIATNVTVDSIEEST